MAGGEITSIKGIAEACGLSYSTVSRVLNGKSYVKEETRQKVMAVVKENNFHPNILAKSLKEGSNRTICLMIPSYGNLIFPLVMRGVDNIARKHNYSVIFSVTDERPAVEQATYDQMLNRQVAGFIICSAIGNEDAIYHMHDEGVPIVLINRFKKDDIGKIDTVSIDSYQVGYDATRYLLNTGRSRIAICIGDESLFLYQERYRGYCAALRDAGIEVDEKLVLHQPATGQPGFKDLIIQMYRNSIRPDAIFATSDPIAFIVIHALHNLHVAIPGETAVISIDNVSLSQYIEPPLTTINQPLIEMGAVATNQLLRQIEYKKKHGILPTPETSFLDYDLIVRQST